jgi:hypothetical protein
MRRLLTLAFAVIRRANRTKDQRLCDDLWSLALDYDRKGRNAEWLGDAYRPPEQP